MILSLFFFIMFGIGSKLLNFHLKFELFLLKIIDFIIFLVKLFPEIFSLRLLIDEFIVECLVFPLNLVDFVTDLNVLFLEFG